MSAPTWTLIAEWLRTDADSPGRLYMDPELVVTVITRKTDERYGVAVEMRFDDEGAYVTGVAVRKHPLAGYRGKRTHVAAREIQRLSLAPIIDAALAFASVAEKPPPLKAHPEAAALGIPNPRPFDPRVEASAIYRVGDHDDLRERGFPVSKAQVIAGEILAPRKPPPRDKSGTNRKFYKWVADEHRRHRAAGRSPAKEIAATMEAPVNRVHQWIHKAREFGDLEPSPRSRRRRDDAGLG